MIKGNHSTRTKTKRPARVSQASSPSTAISSTTTSSAVVAARSEQKERKSPISPSNSDPDSGTWILNALYVMFIFNMIDGQVHQSHIL
jgi:hypothetical protein